MALESALKLKIIFHFCQNNKYYPNKIILCIGLEVLEIFINNLQQHIILIETVMAFHFDKKIYF